MSHFYGSICERHHRIIVPDTCPEPGCFGDHGFIHMPCQPPCPDYKPTPDEQEKPDQ